MQRRDILKSALAGAAALAAPNLALAQGKNVLRFVPQSDLASLDPVWTTADVTRNYSLAVFDTLFGLDAQFNPQPQMLAGFTTSADKLTWELTLRDGLMFHDNTKVLATDCIASIKRFAQRDPLARRSAPASRT